MMIAPALAFCTACAAAPADMAAPFVALGLVLWLSRRHGLARSTR